MVDTNEWQGRTGETWAAEWRRTDRSFTLLTERLLQRMREFTFRRMLDVGCGAGELSLATARGRREVQVTGVDVSPQLIAVARERGEHLANCEFVLADATEWVAEERVAPDLVVSRHGVMFFDDPPAAFANLSRQGAQGASLMFSCFRDLADNPFFTEVSRLLPQPPHLSEPHAPGPFAFAEEGHVRDLLQSGGWTAIEFERFDFPMIAGSGQDAVEDAITYFCRVGPAARATSEMEPDARARFLARVRQLCERREQDGLVALPASAWIVTAKKGG